MARLIVLDASVAIAALVARDAHHDVARRALAAADDDELVIAATTRTEILIGPLAAGGAALRAARHFIAGCSTIPVAGAVADEAAALRARHRALSVPDAMVLAVARRIEADAVWTFDRAWTGVDPRVTPPS